MMHLPRRRCWRAAGLGVPVVATCAVDAGIDGLGAAVTVAVLAAVSVAVSAPVANVLAVVMLRWFQMAAALGPACPPVGVLPPALHGPTAGAATAEEVDESKGSEVIVRASNIHSRALDA